jgi:hypothetical protein
VEGDHRGLFEIDSESGLFYLPDGQGNKLDYEGLINTYVIDITVRDRCEKDGYCYGKLEEGRCENTFIYWPILIFILDINKKS